MRRALVAAALLACGPDPVAYVERPDGERLLRVHVEVARTAAERRRGLRGRESLADDEGLWIAFPVEGEVCLVNSGVPFAVGALFLDGDGVVTSKATLTADDGTPVCAPARDVLEITPAQATLVSAGDRARLRP